VQAAGGLALMLPPDPRAQDDPDEWLDLLDGLILAGGADVDPAAYGADRHPATVHTNPERDAFEIALAQGAIARDLPFLGICRGMQVLNVALGGDLIQHLPDEVGSELHRPMVGAHGRHHVELAPECRLAEIVGPRAEIATYHHQGVRTLGKGLTACGWADDGIVEAVELADRTWVLGVQWHPEAYEGHALFAAFVAACAEGRT
jgi:putative glutamine amidotransferase